MLVKIVFYLVTGLVLLLAASWYVQSLYSTLADRGEVVIAPFEIIGVNGQSDTTRATALAHMLQAQLRDIEQGIASAQKTLMGARPQETVQAQGTPQSFSPTALLAKPPLVIIQGVALRTQLLDPADVKVSVGGVEVGGAVSWIQRRLINSRTAVFTLYEKKDAAVVTGNLQAMGLGDEVLSLEVRRNKDEDAVPLDRVVQTVAYEIVRRRLMVDPDNHVEALNEGEFETLVGLLRDAAVQNRRLTQRNDDPPEFRDLLDRAVKLSDVVKGWYQLNYLAAGIAESAGNWDVAGQQYQHAKDALAKQQKYPDLLKGVDVKIAEMKLKAGSLDAEGKIALEKLQGHVDEAVDFYNQLLGLQLKPPPVKIQTDESLKFSPYWDWTNIVEAKEVQYIPDLSFRNAVWPHLLQIAGAHSTDRNDARTDILYSYANVLTILAQQHHLQQNEKTSDWVLAKGYIDWSVDNKVPAKPYEGMPWASLKEPGKAYASKNGNDPQVAHMRDYVNSDDPTRRYINSGILDKSFYTVATKLTSQRAAEIWIAALRELKDEKQISFPRFAKLLYEHAGQDKDVVRGALAEVGLDPVPSGAKQKESATKHVPKAGAS